MGLLTHHIVSIKLPLVEHEALDTGLTKYEIVFLRFAHLKFSSLSNHHVCLDPQLLEIVQVLLQL